ncbi:MAG: response regulator, partial [Candidatus Aminicenantes bacterium]|nr:response regulator [Candidatus Aminicenantes bacterium]
VLMDTRLLLPGRASFVSRLKTDPRWSDIPVLAMLMSPDEDQARKALAEGFEGYISKPVETRSLLKTVYRYLNDGSAAAVNNTGPGLEGRKILIVNGTLREKTFLDTLTSHGYELFATRGSDESLAMAAGEKPDIILIDLHAPDVDALEVTQRLKQDPRTKAIPIIMLTDLDDQENRLAGLEAGAEEFLTKPISPVELLARVSAVFRLKDLRTPNGRLARTAAEPAAAGPSAKAGKDAQSSLPVILLVENDTREAKAIQKMLKGLPARVETAPAGELALTWIDTHKADLIILDLLLPDMDGFEACRRLKEMTSEQDVPIVIASYVDDVETRVRCLEIGAERIFPKPVGERELRVQVRGLLERRSKSEELRRRYQAAMNSAVIDWLTGLHSPGFFRSFVGMEIRRAERQNYVFTLLLLDVDGLKTYNDAFGRPGGDIILQEIAHVIRNTMREIDLAARLNDDEFALLLPFTDKAGGFQAAQRIRQGLETYRYFFESFAQAEKATVGTGIVMYPTDATTLDGLLAKANQMLFRAKKKGKAQISL